MPNNQVIAIELIRLAAVVFPPLGALLAGWLRQTTSTDPLVEELRSVLPADGASGEARRRLEDEGAGR